MTFLDFGPVGNDVPGALRIEGRLPGSVGSKQALSAEPTTISWSGSHSFQELTTTGLVCMCGVTCL